MKKAYTENSSPKACTKLQFRAVNHALCTLFYFALFLCIVFLFLSSFILQCFIKKKNSIISLSPELHNIFIKK